MKKGLLLIFLLLLLSSCDKKSKIEKEVEEIPIAIKVERFDKIFYESPVENLQNVKNKYPYFFPAQTPDSVWVNKIKNPLYRELYSEVQKKYSNFEMSAAITGPRKSVERNLSGDQLGGRMWLSTS